FIEFVFGGAAAEGERLPSLRNSHKPPTPLIHLITDEFFESFPYLHGELKGWRCFFSAAWPSGFQAAPHFEHRATRVLVGRRSVSECFKFLGGDNDLRGVLFSSKHEPESGIEKFVH